MLVMRKARISAVIVGLLVLGFVSASHAQAETPDEIFARGNAAYEAGQFEAAHEAYMTLVKYRIRDPRVEFNLGNTEFRLGRLGASILHFERARRLDPVDPDIRQNLLYARTFCFDRVESPPVPSALAWFRDFRDRIGPDRQLWLAVILLWTAAAAVAFGLARPGRWRPLYGWTLSLIVVGIVLVGLSWRSTWTQLEGTPQAVVLRQAVEVLAGPGTSNATLFTVHEGLTIEVRGMRDDWVQVGLPNGLNGWIPKDSIGIV